MKAEAIRTVTYILNRQKKNIDRNGLCI